MSSALSPWKLHHRGRALLDRMRQGILRKMARRAAPAPDAGFGERPRILLIRVGGIGDVVMMLPSVRALRRRFPDAQIDVLVRPWSVSLFFEPGLTNNIWVFEPGNAPRRTRDATPYGTLGLIRRLRRQRYDLAIDIAGREWARQLAFWSGARRRGGPLRSRYDTTSAPEGDYAFLLSDPVTLPDGGDPASPEHPVDSYLHVLRGLGINIPSGAPYDLTLPGNAIEAARRAIQELGITHPFAIVHPIASKEVRNWPLERWAAVAEHLVRAHDLDVLVTGSARDGKRVEEMLRGVCFRERIFAATGTFSLPQLAAVYAHAEIMVSADTGPTHLADMAGTPLVVLFLPWHAVNRPYRQPDAIVLPPGLPERCAFNATPPDVQTTRYLDRISVEQVRERVDAKLRTRQIERALFCGAAKAV